MANELATVAQGEMTLQIAAATQFFKFEIQADGIQFRRRDSAGGPWSDQQTLFSLLGPTTPALRKGDVTFAGLSA